MSHIIYSTNFEQTITHQHILLRRESQSHVLLGRESQSSTVTIILSLHVLIARCTLLIFAMLIIFGEYRCLKH